MKLVYIFLIIFASISMIQVDCVEVLLNEGDQCKFNNKTQGICKYLHQCPIVQKVMRTTEPVMCGLNGVVKIVCCPRAERYVRYSKPKMNTTGKLAKKFCEDNAEDDLEIDAKGGVDARLGEFKSMVAIGWELENGNGYAWNCGGTLISEKYVLTAAHCAVKMDSALKTVNPTIVRLGTINLNKTSSSTQDVAIAEIFVHPNYTPPSKYNDIALFKLDREVLQVDMIKAACLMLPNNFTSFLQQNKSLNAFGWGEVENSKLSAVLQKVTLNIVKYKTCKNKFRKGRVLPKGIIDSQICAGANGTQDTCRGDSGGPLAAQIDDTFYLVGVTSFGFGCFVSRAPGVYTKVSSYIGWIEDIVWASI